jgi:hypothetical protein
MQQDQRFSIMHHKLAAAAATAAAAAAMALSLTGVAGAAASHSGKIAYQAVTANNGKPADVVTGALNDHGTDKGVGKNGEKIILSRGTFTIDATRFNKSVKVKMDKKDCIAIGHGFAANLPISKGTGAYKDITGTITVRGSFTFFGVLSDGKCNLNRSTASASVFSGTGHLSY